MKKVIWGVCLFFLGLGLVYAEENDLALNAKSAVLMDFNSGEILYQKNENEALPPASMTKIASMLLIMEEIDAGRLSFDDDVTISERASSMGGSQLFLQTGEVYKVRELLKGVAVASGNDAILALSEKAFGSVENFVTKMNEKANSLGLTSTVFKNPHGLDTEGHTSSARDMAILARELIKHEKILEFTRIYEDYLKKNDGTSIWLVNTNRLVRFYDGVDGLKTGFTQTAGYCLTATAKKNNLRLIAVVMGEETSDKRSSDITNMLNYGFNSYKNVILYSKDNALGTKRVENGEEETVSIALKEDYTKLLKNTDDVPHYSYNVEVDSLKAPLEKGQIYGQAQVIDDNGQRITSLDVTVLKSVNKASYFKLFLRNIKNISAGKILIK